MVLSKNKRGGSRKMNTIKRGGNRKMNNKRGGAVRMPLEYFGGNSDKYFPSGDAALKDGSSAYGPFYSVSQGVASPDGQMFGPNVGPYPNSSCTQTGGRRRSARRSKKSKYGRK
jgi:hypothetical protein